MSSIGCPPKLNKAVRIRRGGRKVNAKGPRGRAGAKEDKTCPVFAIQKAKINKFFGLGGPQSAIFAEIVLTDQSILFATAQR
jgi:hypothetical protein